MTDVDADDLGDTPDAEQVARRALALFAAFGAAVGADPAELRGWLDENGLASDLTPNESAYLTAEQPTRKQKIEFSWQSERLVMLLWALGLVDILPADDEQCDTSVFQQILPPFTDATTGDFIAQASLRPWSQLVAEQERCVYAHWQARDSNVNGTSPKSPVDIEIIQERHHAINWVIGYEGQEWDRVTTDT